MRGSPNRRALLRTGALALGSLAGCVGSLGDDSTDEGPSRPETTEATMTGATTTVAREPTGTTTPPSDSLSERTDTESTDSETTENHSPPLAVEAVRTQSSFLFLTYPDAAAVATSEGTQFVFADVRPVRSGALAPTRDAFALVADDRRFAGTLSPGPADIPSDLYEMKPAYDPDEYRTGWVAFEVPDPLDADAIALTYESEGRTYSESLDSETVEALATPSADFELVSLDAPESVGRDEPFEVSLVVENVSEFDGVFRACLNQTAPLYAPNAIEVSVPAGNRGEWTRTFGQHVHDDAEQVSFSLVSPVSDRKATVEVVSETTTTT